MELEITLSPGLSCSYSIPTKRKSQKSLTPVSPPHFPANLGGPLFKLLVLHPVAKGHSTHYIVQRLKIGTHRDPIVINFYIQQGRPYLGKSPELALVAVASCDILWLQSSTPFGSVSFDSDLLESLD